MYLLQNENKLTNKKFKNDTYNYSRLARYTKTRSPILDIKNNSQFDIKLKETTKDWTAVVQTVNRKTVVHIISIYT